MFLLPRRRRRTMFVARSSAWDSKHGRRAFLSRNGRSATHSCAFTLSKTTKTTRLHPVRKVLVARMRSTRSSGSRPSWVPSYQMELPVMSVSTLGHSLTVCVPLVKQRLASGEVLMPWDVDMCTKISRIAGPGSSSATMAPGRWTRYSRGNSRTGSSLVYERRRQRRCQTRRIQCPLLRISSVSEFSFLNVFVN